MTSPICLVCNSTDVSVRQSSETVTFGAADPVDIVIDYSVCDNCGNKFISTSQMLENEARRKANKRK